MDASYIKDILYDHCRYIISIHSQDYYPYVMQMKMYCWRYIDQKLNDIDQIKNGKDLQIILKEMSDQCHLIAETNPLDWHHPVKWRDIKKKSSK